MDGSSRTSPSMWPIPQKRGRRGDLRRRSRPATSTGPATELDETSFTLTGHIDPAGRGDITECHFEYGFDKTYGTVRALPRTRRSPPGSNFTGPRTSSATVRASRPGPTSTTGSWSRPTPGATRSATTKRSRRPAAGDRRAALGKPDRDAADLNAQINPNGLETTYRFEYGPTSIRAVAPVPDGTIDAGNADQPISVQLDGPDPARRLPLPPGRHQRRRHDHHRRPHVQLLPAHLPERKRPAADPGELPARTAAPTSSSRPATPAAPSSTPAARTRATRPARPASPSPGSWATIPNSAASPIDSAGDLYVATRTDTGWVTRYVGLPVERGRGRRRARRWASRLAPRAQEGESGRATSQPSGARDPDNDPEQRPHRPEMNTFVDWNDGNQSIESIFGADSSQPDPDRIQRPLRLERGWKLPRSLADQPRRRCRPAATPAGSNYSPRRWSSNGEPPSTSRPAAMQSLDCPYVYGSGLGDLVATSARAT